MRRQIQRFVILGLVASLACASARRPRPPRSARARLGRHAADPPAPPPDPSGADRPASRVDAAPSSR